MAILYKSVPIPSDLLEALGDDTGLWWSSPEIEPIIHEAIRAWLKSPRTAKPQLRAAAAETGYQWKQLFLPEGTKLRASFGGKPYFAVVAGTEIKHEEHIISPSGFANLHGSGNRNAWKAIWLRLPGSEQWMLADTCRALQASAMARMFGAAVQ
jgi:hypothetical protein